jgi:glycosyl hydrolase family 39 (putative alpha-L-iduronidase)
MAQIKIRKCFRFAVTSLPLLLVGCASLVPQGKSTTPITPTSFAEDEIGVDFAAQLGHPTYRASGFIYGISEDGTRPEQELQKDIKVQFIRAGGAQLGCPEGGFVNGRYTRRWNSVKSYYARTKAIGAKFILLPHDLWGADAVCNVPRWPGDGGDWAEFTQFMGQVIDDAKANGMTGPDVQWDIWNEPDLITPVQFWGRDQAQYLEMWKRAYQQIRAAIPEAIIVGPSTAGQPSPDWNWFTTYLDYVKTNQVVPNYISWHQLVPESDPHIAKQLLDQMLAERGISVQGYQVNEYGSNISEQQAGPSAWYLGRFERDGIDALRANWGMGGGLYEGMGDLVTGSNQPMASWWIYKRYADMTGVRVAIKPGSRIDGVAVIDSEAKKAIIVLGSREGLTGKVLLTFENIPPVLQDRGKLRISVERMPEGSASLEAPNIVLDQHVSIRSVHSLVLPLTWLGAFDGYTLTLSAE